MLSHDHSLFHKKQMRGKIHKMTAKESNSWGEAEKQEHRQMSFMLATGKSTKVCVGGGGAMVSYAN